MSHKEQMDFFQKVYDQFESQVQNASIIEIGSLIINGSLREIFKTRHYVGVDLEQGHGVNVISKGHEVLFQNNTFDVALSAECFEHDKHWIKTFQKMINLVKSGGIVAFSCATTGRAEHGTHQSDMGSSPFTLDYYQNLTEADFRSNFDFDELFSKYEFSVDVFHHDLYFWGVVS